MALHAFAARHQMLMGVLVSLFALCMAFALIGAIAATAPQPPPSIHSGAAPRYVSRTKIPPRVMAAGRH